MLYQEYQQKMEKLAKVRKFFFRYRLIFILAIAAVLSLTITLMGITGTVQDGDCPDSFIYGNEITYSAGAIMQDVYYEYSTDGITWTTTVPTEIGYYQVRAVSKGIFGSKRTGAAHAFSILPQLTNVYIAENSITYGDLPTVRADLSYDDTITCSDFIFEDPTKSTTKVTPKASAITILNKDGEDVTSSYNLNIISSELTLSKRLLAIKVSSDTATYSAAPLTVKIPDGYEITDGSLSDVFGDSLVCSLPLPSITDVGSVSNQLEFRVINKNGEEVTDRYSIVQSFGKLTIEQKLMYVNTGSNTSYYDGEEHSYNLFTQDGLIDGHSIDVVTSTKVCDVNGEGTENILTVKVKDGNGTDVSANYNIVYTYGNLTVSPRPITIKSASENWIYDGQLHSAETTEVISGIKLAGEDTIKVVSCEKIQDCSEAVNRIVCDILDKNKSNNTSNYKISYEYGTISVEKRVITIKANSKTFEYDGLEHCEESFTTVSDLGIADGQIPVFASSSKITNVGTILNDIVIMVSDGEKEVTSNYEINYQPGVLEVTCRALKIKTPTDSKIYDGTPLTNTNITADRLAPNQTIKVLSSAAVTDVAFDDSGEVTGFDNIIVFRIEDAGGNDVIEQYSIDFDLGTLTVLRRPLNVSSESKTFEYTGESMSWPYYTLTGGTSLASGQNAEIIDGSVSSVRNVSEGKVDNILEIKITGATGDVTPNYLISYTYGKLSVSKKALAITSKDGEKVYDGSPLTRDEFSSEGLISGHTVIAVITGTITDAGSEENTIESATVMDGDEEVTGNYDISFKSGTLTITKREITITTGTSSFTYNDEDHEDTSFEVTEGELVSGHTASVSGEITKVHDVTDGTENIFEVSVSDGTNDVSANYEITYSYGTLTVSAKEVSVTTFDKHFTYTKSSHSNNEEGTGYSLAGIIEGHTATVDEYTSVIYAVDGGTPNEITFTVKDGNENDVTSNYSFSYATVGKLYIDPVALEITTPSKEFVYNGAEQYFIDGYTSSGLIEGDEITVISSAGVRDVTAVSQDNTFTVSVGDGENDASLSYNISWVYGKLSVTAREITITGNTISVIYDHEEHSASSEDFTVDNLVEGHTVTATVTASRTLKGSTPVVVSDAVILDEEDNNVTANYDITYVDGLLTVSALEIEVTTLGEDFTYDDKDHTFTEFEITSETGLVEGDILVVNSSTVFRNVLFDPDGGIISAQNEFLSVSVMRETTDVTENYDITYVCAQIKVLPKEVTLTADGNSKTYDGTALSAPSTFSSEGLISGHTAAADVTGSRTEAGEGASVLSNVVIKDASENDVTANYSVTCLDGVLLVEKKGLTITTVPVDKIYDGTPLSGSFTTDGLVETVDEILPSLISLTSSPDAGIQEFMVASEDGQLRLKITKKATGYDSTANYNITFVNGQGTISKRPITIKSETASKSYDGTELYDDSVSYGDANALLETHEIVVVSYTSITEIGSEENALSIIIKDKTSEEDVTKNYNITTDFGTLTITGREIEITVSDLTLEYNGELQGQTDTTAFEVTDGELASGHIIITDTLTFTGGQTAIGKYSSEIGIDTDSIKVEDADGNDVTGGYTFTIVRGSLEITKRTVVVATEDKEFVYDGNAHFYNELNAGYHLSTGSMLEGHVLTLESFTTVTDVVPGGVDNVLTFSLDASYADFYNLSVSDEYGKLTVTPKHISVETGSLTSVYNKQDQFSSSFSVSELTPLVSGHSASVSEYTKVKDVTLDENGEETSVKNLLTVVILDTLNGDRDVTANYAIEYLTGELLILRRTFTISTSTEEKVYDGEYIEGNYTAEYDDKDGFTPDDYDITLTKEKNAGVYPDEITSLSFYRLIDASVREDVTFNYNIVVKEEGTITISPRPVSFAIGSATWPYDGLEHSLEDFEEVTDGTSQIITGHTVSVKEAVTIRNVSRVNNYVTLLIEDESGEDVTGNYLITENDDAYLEITKVALKLRIKNASFEYNGGYFGKENFVFSTDGLALSDFVFYDTPQLGTEPGEYTIYFSSLLVTNAMGEDVSANYDITQENGTLTILKRKITVESEEWHEIYQAGESYNHNVVKVTSGSLVSGHVLVTQTITLAAKYADGTPNVITLCEIVLENNPDEKVTEFYDITKVENLFYIGNPFISFRTNSKTVFLDELGPDGILVFNENTDTETAYEIDDHLLMEGHHIVFSITGSQTGLGTSPNTISYSILDASAADVTSSYDIRKEEGNLTVKKRTISITTGSGTWLYDGNSHSSDIVSLDTDEIKEGYRFCHEDPSVTITDPGTAYNTVNYWIEDSEGVKLSPEDLSKYYVVEENFGELTVEGIPVFVQSASDSKDYDGTPLTNSRVDIIYSLLRDGDYIDDAILTAATGSNTGKADETTREDNTVDQTKFKVLSEGGEDVTSLYHLYVKTGQLTVYATEEEEKDEEDDEQVVLTVLSSEENAKLYLKINVFGDYTLTGDLPFSLATKSTDYITVDGKKISADYIASLILKNYGKELNTATVTTYIQLAYPLPYYMDPSSGTYDVQTSDAMYSGNSSKAYTVGYYSMSMNDLQYLLSSDLSLGSDHKAEVEAYNDYVKDTYLTIDTETKGFMDGIIDNNNLDNPSLSLYQKITGVASYIQSSAEYSVMYNKNLDSEANVAIAFLSTYKSGLCRHFATAATMLYRALGIPARLATGFYASTGEANTPTDITYENYHAWVEVYVDNYGWFQVEVTGGNNHGDYYEHGEIPEIPPVIPDSISVTVKPADVIAEYDGTSHSATHVDIIGPDGLSVLESLVSLGFDFSAEFNGEGIIPGTYESSIKEGSFHITKDGIDITDACSIIYETGTIKITKRNVTILSAAERWQYDGQIHTKNSYTITSGSFINDDKEFVECISSVKEIGEVDNDFIVSILDKDGNDASSFYEITKEYGKLQITKILVVLKTASDSKVYDGEPLTNGWYSLDGAILDIHEFTVNVTGSITDIGQTENTVEFTITDKETGLYAGEYYTVVEELGTLSVAAKIVTVRTSDKSKYYDGTPLAGDPDGYQYSDLPAGYSIEVTVTGITKDGNVQTVPNTFTVKLFDGNGIEDNSFTVNSIYGDLKIQPAVVELKTASKTAYYDGKNPLTCPEYTYKDGDGLLPGHSIYTATNWTVLDSIPEGETLKTDNKTGEKYYEVTNSADFIVMDSDSHDVTANYYFRNTNYGKLRLYRKFISVSSGSAEKEYDGTPLILETADDPSFYIDDANLFEGHHIEYVRTGTITIPGTEYNTYDITVLDEEGADVTYVYDVNTDFGLLTVTKRGISIVTHDAEKKYDGTPLVCNEWHILAGSVLEELGHVLAVNVYGTATEKTEKNSASVYVYEIVDGEEVRLDDLYRIIVYEGTLTIKLREMTITTQSLQKVYDGTPLTDGDKSNITVKGTGALEPGHTLTYDFDESATITYAGSVLNKVSYKITDESGEDVTYLYKVTENFGSLVINPMEITIRTGSKKSTDAVTPLYCDEYQIVSGTFYDKYIIETTGQQTGYGQTTNTCEITCENSSSYLFRKELGLLSVYNPDGDIYASIYSTVNGEVFLKGTSYGEYTGTGFAAASDYAGLLDDTYSMLYLPSVTLSTNRAMQSSRILAYKNFTMPYYPAMDGTFIQTSDIRVSGSVAEEYDLSFYYLTESDLSTLIYSLGSYAPAASSYKTYVYDTYTAVPEATAAYLNANLPINSLNKNASSFISDVIRLVKNAGEYDPDYNKQIDAASNMVATFVSYKKGVSRHFASLATLVFRMMGVPARYTEGAHGTLVKNAWANITEEISFVEIFIDGFGWVPLNVTPEAGEVPDIPEEPEEKIPVTVKPVSREKAYDGIALTAENELEMNEVLLGLQLLGYTWDVTVEGSQFEKGESDAVIKSFTIYDMGHNDVTDKFDITYEKGTLRVTNVQIMIYLYDITEAYDGTEHTFPASEDVFWDYEVLSAALTGKTYTITFDKSKLVLTNAGCIDPDVLRNAATIMDGTEDVTDSFYLVFDGDGFTISRRKISITSGSSTKSSSDTSFLRNETYSVGMSGLAEGDTAEVNISGVQEGKGTSANTISGVVIKNASGDDVTASYDITLIAGTLTLT